MLSHRKLSKFGLLEKMAALAAVVLAVFAGCSSPSNTGPAGANITPLATCGDGVLDINEACDGSAFGAATCATATMGASPYGNLACNPGTCTINTNGCSASSNPPPPPPTTTATNNPPPPPPRGGAGGMPTIPPPSNGGTSMTGTGGGPSTDPGGAPGAGGMDGTAGAAPMGKMDPKIPPAPADCPQFGGTITFGGLGGILTAAGTKPAAPTAPMLVYWHGTGSTSGEYAGMAAPVAQGVQSQGGVIISFSGTTGGDLLSGTNIFGKGDLNVVDGLVACAVANRNVDPRKIYTMGCSAGGLMSVATAILRSEYIAAAAPNSGGVTAAPAFSSMHTPPLMTVHGKMGSDVVIIDFATSSASADKLFRGRGGFVMDCDTGGGHCGGGGLAGDVWKFFQAHPFGVDPDPYAGMLPAGFSTQCKIIP